MLCFELKNFLHDFLKMTMEHLQEILLVLDGNTGLNMLPQAREFNEVIKVNRPVSFLT